MKKSLKMFREQKYHPEVIDQQVAKELDTLARELEGLQRIYVVKVKSEWAGLPERCILNGIDLSTYWERSTIVKDGRKIQVIQRTAPVQL